MLQLIISITIIMSLSVIASCNCLIPANNSIGLNRSDFVAVFADSTSDIDANYAALNRAVSLLNVSFTQTQLAAFLGTVRFNTGNLRRHQARCVESGTCAVQYDLVCSNRTVNDTRHFYPRSAMMISYQCNYADIDSILRSSLPCLRSVETEPHLLSNHLLYSYLASIATWTSTECMALTANDLNQFGVCMDILNPWICTNEGLRDRINLVDSVNVALAALNVSDVQLPSDMSCNNSIQLAIASGSNDTSCNVTISDTFLDNMTNVTDTNCNVTIGDMFLDNMTNMSDPDIMFGVLSRDLFRSYFKDANVSLVDDNYDALIGALLLNKIDQMDPNQIALLLATIRIRTANLTQLEANGTAADLALSGGQIVQNLLSRDLPADIIADLNPDLILFYNSLANDIIRSGCMDDVRQGLYDICLNAMFPFETCDVDQIGHEKIVDAIESAFALLNVGNDLNLMSLKCQNADLTSHAFVSSSVSIWALTSLSVGLMIMV